MTTPNQHEYREAISNHIWLTPQRRVELLQASAAEQRSYLDRLRTRFLATAALVFAAMFAVLAAITGPATTSGGISSGLEAAECAALPDRRPPPCFLAEER